MSKAEDLAEKAYPYPAWSNETTRAIDDLRRNAFIEGYHQAEKDLIDKTLDFLKDKLYENGYVGIIDLCDDYIKAMKDE